MNARKFVAELIGTFVLVFIGCGTAMLVGCDAENGGGYILTAFAFGLSIVAMAYSIGNVSGCHINPAVSLAFLLRKELSGVEFICYVIAQIIGALLASLVHMGVWGLGAITDQTGGYGSNGLAGVNGSIPAGLIVEVILTCIFILAILGVTSKRESHGSFAGLVIGFSLVLVHIIGIGLTGTSVNPARSIGPAVIAAIAGNGEPLSQVWIFIAGPLVGGAIAAGLYTALEGKKTA